MIELVFVLGMQTAVVTYPAYPAGMRVAAGAQGALARTNPALNSGCGGDNHPCTDKDVIPAKTMGTVMSDAPVYESAGWWWSRIAFDNGVTGWASGYPPYIETLTPPTMMQSSNFIVVGDYSGSTVTETN